MNVLQKFQGNATKIIEQEICNKVEESLNTNEVK